MTPAAIQLHSVVPHNLARRDLSPSQIWNTQLELEPGQHYHISAPSGSGKTTLARLLYGIQQKFAGTMIWGQEHIKDFSLKKWSTIRQLQMAIVFQDLRLFAKLSAGENIHVKNELTGNKSQADINAMAGELGIRELLPNTTAQLSQGEQQRVAIIRGLCQPFKWIILDEPFSHLDQPLARKAAALIAAEAKNNQASIICLQLEGDNFFDYAEKLNL